MTFDVYGTLIDWETGVYDAFAAEAPRDGFTIERDELISLFYESQKQIQAGSYELYAEVLRRTAVQIAKKLDWPLEPSRSGFLPVGPALAGVQGDQRLAKIAKKHRVGLIANIDDQLLGPDPASHPAGFRPGRDRPAGPLLQARSGPLHRVRAPHRHQEGLGPHCSQLLLRRRALPEEEGPGDLGQPLQGAARDQPEEARRRGRTPPGRRPSWWRIS